MPAGTPLVQEPELDGALVIDKPSGPTSHDVVARVRRLLRGRRVGHTGTLDPFATGVLPLLLGRATRLARFLTSDTKAYRATLRLGVATSTHDLDGEREIGRFPALVPSPDDVRGALAAFRGRFDQRPPDFSAKKVAGTRAYVLARRHEPVTLSPVTVEVFRLDLDEMRDATVDLSLECSSGFYVRALARDLGESLGCGAHLTALRRTRSGDFDERQLASLESLEQGEPATWPVTPLAAMVPWLAAAHLEPAAVDRVRHGNAVPTSDVLSWDPPARSAPQAGPEAAAAGVPVSADVRLIDPGGRLIGIARRSAGPAPQPELLQPFVVLV